MLPLRHAAQRRALVRCFSPESGKAGLFHLRQYHHQARRLRPTCILLKGEHPDLYSEASVVLYAQTRELPRALIERLSKDVAEMDSQILLKIQTAPLGKNSRLKNAYKEMLVNFLKN